MRILVVGWFSFENMGNTAGDMIALDVVCKWLNEAKISYDVAVDDAFFYEGSIRLELAEPSKYTDLIFVCGPFGNGWPVTDLLQRFEHCRLTGINLSLLQSLDQWDPFTLLYERDSSRTSHPDITFYGPKPTVPVVGLILIGKQDEYGEKDLHIKAHSIIETFLNSREVSVVKIDTVLKDNSGGLKTPGEIEALIARMDVVITTRLHGTVLAIKNGVPVIAVDAVSGSAKITTQVKTIGWPVLFQADQLDERALSDAFDYCLTGDARFKAKECADKAIEQLDSVHQDFKKQLTALKQKELSYMLKHDEKAL